MLPKAFMKEAHFIKLEFLKYEMKPRLFKKFFINKYCMQITIIWTVTSILTHFTSEN